MSDKTEIRSGGEADAGNGDGERAGEQSPLQGRAAFIKTGTGSLSPASTEDRAIEEKLSSNITRKLMTGSDSDGKPSTPNQ
jgi:hypothetical protein